MIIDIDAYGKVNADGSLLELTNQDAVKNALLLWLGSKRGEYVMNPTAGGVLDASLFKNINEANVALLKLTLFTDLQERFSPSITVEDISVVPDYELRLLEITIKYVNQTDGNQDQLTFYTKDTSAYEHKEYQIITYSGNNLEEFVRLKKPEMKTKILEYNIDLDKWVWGMYIFEGFSFSSPNFETVLTLCNLT